MDCKETIEYIGPYGTYVQVVVSGPTEESIEMALELIDDLNEDDFIKQV